MIRYVRRRFFQKEKIRSDVPDQIQEHQTRALREVFSAQHKVIAFRLHQKNLPGKPDIVLKKHNVVINVNGCFWHHHKCGKYKIPRTNRKFWLNKLNKNNARDEINTKKLRKLGWKVYKIWECKLINTTKNVIKYL